MTIRRTKNGALRDAAIALSLALNASFAMAQRVVCSSAPPDASTVLHRVVILRPRVAMATVKFHSQSSSEGAAEQVEAGFQSVMSQIFGDQGFKPLLDPILMPEWEAKNAVGVKAVRDDFDNVYVPSGGCETLLKSSFASDLEKLADSDGFDGLVVARANGGVVTKSGEWNKGGASQGELSFSIALVSRASGQIVRYCASYASGDYVGDPTRWLSGPIQKCLQHWAGHKSP
jgi:hypothetical protein